ncbi:MAG TPA: rRNA maturation RNase YbeY [Ignavibacteria bacterium]|nr:rRNA maturation RNase YbeY [Ignavibacteria bacterium]
MLAKKSKRSKPEISLTYEKNLLTNSQKLFLKQRINKIVELLSDFEDFNIIELNFLFCSDKTITDYNKNYLKHNFATDIITFEYDEEEEILSDIIVSVETVKKNANDFKQEFKTELTRVIIHGILHLCGYKDKTNEQKKKMKQKENYYLKKV